MAEIIGFVVPNQRLDRITNFLKELDKRLTKIEVDRLEHNKFSLDLFEDGMYQAVKVLTESRNKYLANFLKRALDVDSDSYPTKKKLLNILQELTDKDIEILRSISIRWYQSTAKEYGVRPLTIGEVRALSEHQKSEYDHARVSFGLHIASLNRLNLVHIENRKIDPKFRNSYLDYNTGLPEVEDCKLTNIGKLLLENIAEVDG